MVRRDPQAGARAAAAAALALLLACGVAVASSERGFRGYLAARGDKVLGEENAKRLFVPGSVQKLLVSAAALHYLGPEYRVTTPLTALGEISGGVLAGDLVARAAGDPS